MDSGETVTASAVEAYDGLPDSRVIGRHAIFPQTTHDDVARINFLAQLNRHLATQVAPFVRTAWESRVEPAARAEAGRPARDRHEVRKALLRDPMFNTWSALRRMTMEQRQQAGRWIALRQAEALAAKAAVSAGDKGRLTLNPALPMPRYVSAVDHHCMAGSYHTEQFPGDVSAGANYDVGLFITTGGLLGRWSDGGGRAIVDWVKQHKPDFKPKRILDIGATLGHNVLPIAAAFPEAEVIAVDLGAPMLRYALARAKSLGIDNVRFVQADATDLSMFEDQSFDWIQTTMFLHELSLTSMQAIFRESHRLLKPGGVVLHVEQPQYTPQMPLFEQAMRDWDAFYNNEPFWSTLHEIDLDRCFVDAGFDAAKLIHDHVSADARDIFPAAADDTVEDFGRKAAWRLVGAER
ncbi:MAG TPA: class I SAM-dependent methyltransferase [Caulobacteraceae bacterium]|nr:class I SAM-dependent methyltransferase [Caulobacteraceae bacterium]